MPDMSDSAVVMSPVGVYSQRPNSLPVAPSPVINEPDSTTYNTQNVAPRFKNKLKTMQGMLINYKQTCLPTESNFNLQLN